MREGYNVTSREQCTHVEKLKLACDGHGWPCITRIPWCLDNTAITTPGFLLRDERTREIEERDDGTTAFRMWETFGGPIARMVRSHFEADFKDRTQNFAVDLKAWVEKRQHAMETR